MKTIRRTGSRPTAVLLLLVVALVTTSCAGEKDPLEIGLRRVALDLAFKDAEKAVPVEPRVVVRELVEYVDFEGYEFEEAPPEAPRRRIPRVIPPRQTEPPCEKASENLTPEVPAFHVLKGQPKVGTYGRHNTGKIGVVTATSTFDLPFPARSEWDITDVESAPRVAALRPEDQDRTVPEQAEANERVAPKLMRFTISRYSRGLPVTHTTYEYDEDFLYLTERRTVSAGQESVFRPTPPIRFIALNVTEGTDSEVTFAGMDRETNTAMTITSKIVGREWVDVCGIVYDSYRVEWQEQFVNLADGTPSTSGNSGDQVNAWNIQFDNGLLVLREQGNYTVQTTFEIAGAPVPVTLNVEYETVLDKIDPDPLEDRTAPTPPVTTTTTPEDEEE